jgi:signal-transduction protein with cAMP-binding, CBS, and nucleotidyltransferase domain
VNIIKTSLFFICHWTKNFQTEIAKKLVKKILIPNENIIQNLGKERIYIIKSGKLEIYTDNSHGLRKNFKKLLKTIEPKSNTGISDNVYGYTTVISNKPLKFNAISKDFTCVYSIDKNNFMDCVHENKLDSEYYFEIKANLDTTKYIEGY